MFSVARITPWWNVITYQGYNETVSAAQEDSPAAGLAGLQSKTQPSNIWILVCDHSGRSSSHLNIYTLLFLYSWFLYQVAVDSGRFQRRFSICGLTVTENQSVPVGVFFFFNEAHLCFFHCETPVFKNVRESTVAAREQNGCFPSLHPRLCAVFFSNLEGCSCSSVKLEFEMQLWSFKSESRHV